MAGRTKFHLSEKQYEELLLAEKQVDKPRLLKKIQCIKLKDKWRKHEKVSDLLMVSIQTISARTTAYSDGWIMRLLAWNYEGKVSVFTTEIMEDIREKNKVKPFDTAKEAKRYIKEKYNMDFHLHYIQKLIKKNFIFHIKSRR